MKHSIFQDLLLGYVICSGCIAVLGITLIAKLYFSPN